MDKKTLKSKIENSEKIIRPKVSDETHNETTEAYVFDCVPQCENSTPLNHPHYTELFHIEFSEYVKNFFEYAKLKKISIPKNLEFKVINPKKEGEGNPIAVVVFNPQNEIHNKFIYETFENYVFSCDVWTEKNKASLKNIGYYDLLYKTSEDSLFN